MSKSPRPSSLRGTRHLRVGVEIGGAQAPRVTSVWLVEQPAVQHLALTAPIITRIDVGGRPVLVQSSADPRVVRGTHRDDRGHSFLLADAGILYVSVPFTEAIELGTVRIHIAELEGVAVARDPVSLAQAFDDPPPGACPLGTVTAPDLERHPDWEQVARALGFEAPPGCFEIHQGDDGRFHWCLRRRDGRVMACSPTGHEERRACEQELRWVRERAAACLVRARDLGHRGPDDRSC